MKIDDLLRTGDRPQTVSCNNVFALSACGCSSFFLLPWCIHSVPSHANWIYNRHSRMGVVRFPLFCQSLGETQSFRIVPKLTLQDYLEVWADVGWTDWMTWVKNEETNKVKLTFKSMITSFYSHLLSVTQVWRILSSALGHVFLSFFRTLSQRHVFLH